LNSQEALVVKSPDLIKSPIQLNFAFQALCFKLFDSHMDIGLSAGSFFFSLDRPFGFVLGGIFKMLSDSDLIAPLKTMPCFLRRNTNGSPTPLWQPLLVQTMPKSIIFSVNSLLWNQLFEGLPYIACQLWVIS
jgi:hypothetical protein